MPGIICIRTWKPQNANFTWALHGCQNWGPQRGGQMWAPRELHVKFTFCAGFFHNKCPGALWGTTGGAIIYIRAPWPVERGSSPGAACWPPRAALGHPWLAAPLASVAWPPAAAMGRHGGVVCGRGAHMGPTIYGTTSNGCGVVCKGGAHVGFACWRHQGQWQTKWRFGCLARQPPHPRWV